MRSARTRRLLSNLLIAYVALELSALGMCWALAQIRGLYYEDVSIPETLISEAHREFLQKLIDGKTVYFDFSPTLGWTIKPGGAGKSYRANGQGLRGDVDYSLNPPDDVIRLAAFGDSFTHCDGLDNEQTWESQLAAMDPRLEVLNFGVSGYGPDQAFLRYLQDGVQFKPHIVLIGFMPENINRVVSVFRPFYGPQTRFPLSKPRFVLDEDDQLTLIPNPLPRIEDYRSLLDGEASVLSSLKQKDYFFDRRPLRSRFDVLPSVRLFKLAAYAFEVRFRPGHITDLDGSYNVRSEAFALIARLLTEFHSAALSNGALPIVLLFPTPYDIARDQRGMESRYAPLVDSLSRAGVMHVDLLRPFADYGTAKDIGQLYGGHYTAAGARVVARSLLQWVEQNRLTTVEGIREARGRLSR